MYYGGMNVKRWSAIFRALANPNRLQIVKLLRGGEKMTVTDICEKLEISLKATSNHLILLKNLDIVDARGSQGHVFYWFNQELPGDIRKVIDTALK